MREENRSTFDNIIIIDGDEYEWTCNEDGTDTIHCEKNKNGFKATVHYVGSPEQWKQSYEAVKRFYIRNLL
ncbi:hypothetical protein [Cohnella soli]|uniref:Uncharacterized protein n=1 Tax=Cohnella soli TaxID=425005 RepID=A0ABW0HJV3_9BACL